MKEFLNGLVIAVCVFFTSACGLKRPVLVEPTDGPVATIQAQNGDGYFTLYKNHSDCSEMMVLRMRGSRENKPRWNIPAEDLITIGTSTDGKGGGMSFVPVGGAVVPVINSGSACHLVFTFSPKDGESYTITPAYQANNCSYKVLNSSGSEVPVQIRTHIWGDYHKSAFCKTREQEGKDG